jgi:hypothetical protein
MKTEELIDLLSTNVEPVDPRTVVRNLRTAIVAGLAVALLTCIVARGVRPDLTSPAVFEFLLVKIGFGAAVAFLGSRLLLNHTRPGRETRSRMLPVALPFLAMIVLAGANLISVSDSHWGHMIIGTHLRGCLLSIPMIAVMPFAAIVWAVRMAAPTDLRRTGAVAGLVAGGISAIAYALHCPDDSLPFIALWYSGTILLCTLAGAALGSRLLHW